MEGAKLYTCVVQEQSEEQSEEQSLYVIYSVKVKKLNKSDPKPTFIKEKVISGFPNMGCGVFGSKIVLAGGVWGKRKERKYNLQLITYDTVTKRLSRKDLPRMRGRKFRPLVFELYGRLYVLDTSKSLFPWSFEIYFPTRKCWDLLSDPFDTKYSHAIGKKKFSETPPHAWFVVGNALCISAPPGKLSFFHHARQGVKTFATNFYQSIPFHGMAITYWQPDFNDVVVISFSKGKGCVEGRRLTLGFPEFKFFGQPKHLFDTDPYEQPHGELSVHFTDCGYGSLCLTTFDNMNMHVYLFKILRNPDREGDLNLVLIDLVKHKFTFNDFLFEGCRFVNLPCCFVLPRDDRTKRVEEAKLYYEGFFIYEDGREGIDVPSCFRSSNGYIKSRTTVESDNRETDSSGCESCSDADSSG